MTAASIVDSRQVSFVICDSAAAGQRTGTLDKASDERASRISMAAAACWGLRRRVRSDVEGSRGNHNHNHIVFRWTRPRVAGVAALEDGRDRDFRASDHQPCEIRGRPRNEE